MSTYSVTMTRDRHVVALHQLDRRRRAGWRAASNRAATAASPRSAPGGSSDRSVFWFSTTPRQDGAEPLRIGLAVERAVDFLAEPEAPRIRRRSRARRCRRHPSGRAPARRPGGRRRACWPGASAAVRRSARVTLRLPAACAARSWSAPRAPQSRPCRLRCGARGPRPARRSRRSGCRCRWPAIRSTDRSISARARFVGDDIEMVGLAADDACRARRSRHSSVPPSSAPSSAKAIAAGISSAPGTVTTS